MLKAALEDEVPEAIYELGMTWVVLGGRENNALRRKSGMTMLERAVELGWGPAATYIGMIYHEGKHGYEQDLEHAVRWYVCGAEMGDPLGMSNYGIALQRGDGGLTQDNETAFQWIKKAADTDENLGVAQYNAALALHAGRGVRMDRKMARYYFERAAKCGVEMAKIWLASADYQ